MKNMFKLAAAGTALTIAGAMSGCDVIHPPEDGAKYLSEKGYKNITGGEISFLNTCGENTFARKYHVTTPEGKQKNQAVCYGLFKYRPLIDLE